MNRKTCKDLTPVNDPPEDDDFLVETYVGANISFNMNFPMCTIWYLLVHELFQFHRMTKFFPKNIIANFMFRHSGLNVNSPRFNYVIMP
jgi:hypothetical protein